MSELHCFFIGLFLVGYFIFRFKITLSLNCFGGQHRWKLSPLAAFNLDSIYDLFWYAISLFQIVFSQICIC